MSFNRKGELGWSINKISHRDNKQKNKSNKNNWGYNTFQAYLSYGSSLGVRQEKDLNVTKDSIEVKDLLSIPSFKSKLIKKFTFINALVTISAGDHLTKSKVKKRWNNKNHVFMLKTRAPSHCQTSARSTASPCTWKGGYTRLLLPRFCFPWIFPFLHKWGMGGLDDDSQKHYHICTWSGVGRLDCHLAPCILIVTSFLIQIKL